MIVKLGRPGNVTKIEVDTNHFKGNYPDRCSVDVLDAPGAVVDALTWQDFQWTEILPLTKLQADTFHCFRKELLSLPRCTHVRLNIFPDGGISRLRVWGHLVDVSD